MSTVQTFGVTPAASGAIGSHPGRTGSSGWLGRILCSLRGERPRASDVVPLEDVDTPLLRDMGVEIGHQRNPATDARERDLFRLSFPL